MDHGLVQDYDDDVYHYLPYLVDYVIVVVVHRRVSWGWSWWWGTSLQYVHACNKFSNSSIKLLIGCRRRVLVFLKASVIAHIISFNSS
jgi:hypothetical protein